MKKIFLLIAGVLVSIAMTADNVTIEQAEQIAAQFLNSHQSSARKPLQMAKRQPLDLKIASDATAYYVFNVGTENGYVIVSGSDLTPQVLAFSGKGSFKEETMPANMKTWLDGYADQIAYLENTKGKYQAPRQQVQRSAVDPLLTSTWGQGVPYNNMCPTDPSTGNRCVTGCVATALAQVINYHKYPSQTIAAIPGYTTETLGISMPQISITTIDWDNMLDSYSGSSTTAQKNAVAQLMLLCGQATVMDYNIASAGGSGADMALDAKALQTYFGYDKTVRVLDRNAFSTITWESLIYDELAVGRPVLYGGLSTGGGHAFVVDGYDGNGLFHINWGWNGDSDSYFLLSVLNPYNNSAIGSSSSNDGFSFEQSAVVGIQHGSDNIIPERFTIYGISNTGNTSYTRSSSSTNFAGINIKMEGYNRSSDTHSFMLNLALVDIEDSVIGTIANSIDVGSVNFNYGGTLTFSDCSFGANLPDGEYYIVPVSQSENSTEWEPCWKSNVYRIKATISDNKLMLTEPSISLSGLIQATGSTKVGHTLPLKAQIVNSGSYFNNYIYLFVDGIRVGGRILEVEGNNMADFEIDFMPMTTGHKILHLAYDDGESYVPFAMGNVTVAEDNSKLDARVKITNSTDGILPENEAIVKVRVTNIGEDYDNNVRLVLYKKNPDDMQYYGVDGQTQHLKIENGTTSTLNFEFANIESQQRYLLSFQYLKAGIWVYDSDRSVEFEQSNTIELSATPTSGEVLAGSYIILNAKPASAKVFYTLDGTEPSENSLVYDSPILIDRNLTINAFATKKNFEQSEMCTRTYTVIENSDADFGDIEVALIDKDNNKKVYNIFEIDSIYIDYTDTEPPVVEVERVSSNGCNLTLNYTMPENVDRYYTNLSYNVSEYGAAYTSSRSITYTWLKPETNYYVSTLAIGKNGRKGEVIRKVFTTSPAPYSDYVLYRNEFYQLTSAKRTTNNGISNLYIYINNSNYVVFSCNGSCSWSSGTYSIKSNSKYSGGLKLSSSSNVKWGDGKLTISGSGSYRTIDFDLDTGGEVYITGHYYGKVQ